MDGADVNCATNIRRDNANRPTLAAAYDTSAGTLQVVVEAPTLRGIKFVGPDSNCLGGPAVNVFGEGTQQNPPSYFNPLGAGGTVKLATGGVAVYQQHWRWKHRFAAAGGTNPYREYDVKTRSVVSVSYVPCEQIPACATAKR